MKELVEDLKIANDNLYSTNQMLEQEIERLQKLLDIEKNKRKLFDKDNQKLPSIIKEVREYIENDMKLKDNFMIDEDGAKYLLKILDEENNK